MTHRNVIQRIAMHATSDGDGVKIQRVHGFTNKHFSPFLMIDEMRSDESSDYIGGFPPHPHRGIETLTYMIKGHFQHQDHMGNVGELSSGGAQWMAAGKGVIHSEMPMMDGGELHGFQIWINQPAVNKKLPANYHDFQPDTINEVELGNGSLVRLIAGDATIDGETHQGPLQQTSVPVTIADWRTTGEGELNLCLNPEHQAMILVYQGTVTIGDQTLSQGDLGLLSVGESISAIAREKAGALLLAGQPIDEKVVHYGPFVMNSMEEINQALLDYQNGVLTD